MVGFGQFGIHAHIRGSAILLLHDLVMQWAQRYAEQTSIECHKLFDVNFSCTALWPAFWLRLSPRFPRLVGSRRFIIYSCINQSLFFPLDF
jgi:hypothetical protein